MSVIVNRPYPIKLCYIKDQQKQEKQADQKISLTFLSSFIQQQKNALKNKQQSKTIQPIYITSVKSENNQKTEKSEDNQNQKYEKHVRYQDQLEVSMQSKLRNIKVKAIKNYDHWKSKKAKGDNQEERLLVNLVGHDWKNNSYVSRRFNLNLRSNKKKKIRERISAFEINEKKKSNKDLMEGQFNSFLSERKQRAALLSSDQPRCVVTKMNNRAFQSLNPTFLTQYKEPFLHRSTTTTTTKKPEPQPQKKKLSKLQIQNKSHTIGASSIHKHTLKLKLKLKQIGDFKWSKLNHSPTNSNKNNKSQKFILNDHY